MRLLLLLLLSVAVVVNIGSAADFVRLRDGRLIEGAVIRQDTLTLYMTSWEQRHLRQPELQVFTRDEVESIWIGGKPTESASRKYSLYPGLMEIGGGFGFQTWQSSVQLRRYLLQLSFHGGYSITKFLGTEVAADFTIPFSSNQDEEYKSLRFGHQVALHIVGSFKTDNAWTPFAYVGGGTATDVPTAGLVYTTTNDIRSLVDIGIGMKLGLNGLGIRAEIRHAYYIWTPDEQAPDILEPADVRSSQKDADATSLRVSLFTYF